MPKFTFDTHNIKKFSALYDACIARGITDAVVLMNGRIDITTELVDRDACLAAIQDAGDGSLLNAKAQKIAAITTKSDELGTLGVETWQAGRYVALSEQETDKRIVAAQFYADNPAEISATNPYIAMSLGGAIISTENTADIDKLSKDMKHRLDYIYMSLVTNGDGSKSELLLRSEINAATTIEQVNAIKDTRV